VGPVSTESEFLERELALTAALPACPFVGKCAGFYRWIVPAFRAGASSRAITVVAKEIPTVGTASDLAGR